MRNAIHIASMGFMFLLLAVRPENLVTFVLIFAGCISAFILTMGEDF